MLKLERLAAVVLCTGLVVAACAAPPDEESPPAGPADGPVEPVEEAAEAEPSSTSTDEAEAEPFAADMRHEDGELASPARGAGGYRRCDRRDNWRCRRGHPGWRWVDSRPFGPSERCCVRVLRPHRPHW